MKRENISAKKTLYILKKDDDDERRKWGLQIHGVDPWDSILYDIVLHINTLTVDDAVQILFETIQKPIFKTTEESKEKLENLALTAKVHSMFIEYFPHVKVSIQDRKVYIYISKVASSVKTDKVMRLRIENHIKELDGMDVIIFDEPLEPKRDHINPYYNL